MRVLQQFTSEQTYSTTAINYDFALITLAAPVSHSLGWFGIQRGTGDVTLDITSAGYPADKPTGTMWQTTCNNVEYVYGANQGVFTDVSQCQNQVRAIQDCLHWGQRCCRASMHACMQSSHPCVTPAHRAVQTFCSTAVWQARGSRARPCGMTATARSTPSSLARCVRG